MQYLSLLYKRQILVASSRCWKTLCLGIICEFSSQPLSPSNYVTLSRLVNFSESQFLFSFFCQIESLIQRWIVVSVRKARGYITSKISQYSTNESRAQNVTTDNIYQFFLRTSLKAFFHPFPLTFHNQRISSRISTAFAIPILAVVALCLCHI